MAQGLQDLGHDVSLASECPGMADDALLVAAREQGRILVSCDKGFGALVHRDGMAHAGVVILRLRADTPANQAAALLAAVRDGRVRPGCFVTLTDADLGRSEPRPPS